MNPSHAARPPSLPARWTPTAIPTWLDDGPGRMFVSATSSPNSCSPIHRRRVTYSSWKYPMWATGPAEGRQPEAEGGAKDLAGGSLLP